MLRYRVLRDYRARGQDGNIVVLPAGTTANFSEEHAAWVNRDSPGTLELAEPEPEPST